MDHGRVNEDKSLPVSTTVILTMSCERYMVFLGGEKLTIGFIVHTTCFIQEMSEQGFSNFRDSIKLKSISRSS